MSCNLTRIDIAGIEPRFLNDVEVLLAKRPEQWFITYGRRTWAEQADLRAKFLAGGPRAAQPQDSAHVGDNFIDGLARAVDVTLVIDAKDVWIYSHPAWQGLIADIFAHPRLHSLVKIGDVDHIEKVGWQLDRKEA